VAKDRRERLESRVDRFVDCLIPALAGDTALFADRPVDTSPLIASLRAKGKANGVTSGDGIPAPSWLRETVEQARRGPMATRDIVDALVALAPALPWYQRSEPLLPDFMGGHANAIVIGPQGLETRKDAIVGVTLMAPNVEYPGHHHPPQELYIALSDGEWRQKDSRWQAPGLGGLVYNPPNVPHSMRAGSKPLLAIWCFWDSVNSALATP